MKNTKKAFADILEKRLVDRIIFAHLEPGFCGIKLVRRQVATPIFPFSFLLRSTPQKSEPYRAAIPYAVGRRISFGATSGPLRKKKFHKTIKNTIFFSELA